MLLQDFLEKYKYQRASTKDFMQLTEEHIGPYELADFYLYHLVRHGASPVRILELAQVAFGEAYDLAAHKTWLEAFYRRFFTYQFKR